MMEYILGVLPTNNIRLASDACTSYGMAGVLTFDQHIGHKSGVDGLFWKKNSEKILNGKKSNFKFENRGDFGKKIKNPYG